MEAVYFDYLLKGIGAPLSTIKLAGNPQLDSQSNLIVNFTVTADPLVTLQLPKLYYSPHTTNDTWEHRNWIEPGVPITPVGVNGNVRDYSVTLPANLATQPVDWYVLVSDTRGAWATTASTLVAKSAGANLGVSKLSNTQYRIGVNGVSNQTLVIQASPDLQNWLPLATNALPSSSWIYTNTVPGNFSNQFYRAMLSP